MNREAYEKLAAQIADHNRRYYAEASPTISDQEYDGLVRQLLEVERSHPEWIVSWSPSLRVGFEPISGFEKITRDVPMLSLDNTYNADDLRDFFKRVCKGLEREGIRFSLEPKIDGFGIEHPTDERGWIMAAWESENA